MALDGIAVWRAPDDPGGLMVLGNSRGDTDRVVFYSTDGQNENIAFVREASDLAAWDAAVRSWVYLPYVAVTQAGLKVDISRSVQAITGGTPTRFEIPGAGALEVVIETETLDAGVDEGEGLNVRLVKRTITGVDGFGSTWAGLGVRVLEFGTDPLLPVAEGAPEPVTFWAQLVASDVVASVLLLGADDVTRAETTVVIEAEYDARLERPGTFTWDGRTFVIQRISRGTTRDRRRGQVAEPRMFLSGAQVL